MAARTVLLNIVGNDRVSRVMRGVARELDNAADSSSRLSKAMDGLGRVGGAGGLATAAAGAAALTKAIVPATAAIAALPAAMAATRIASGTLKVGLVGVGDAMSALAEGDAEALNESLKKLSPNAAAFVKQAAAMRTQVTGLQQAVQNRLFAGLDRDLQALGTTYLPVARTGMVGVAGALNSIGREAVKTASTPWFRGQVQQVFAGTTGVVQTLQGAVRPLLESVLRLTVAGLPLIQRMAGWAVQGIRVAAAWLQAKAESGQLQATITGVGNVLARLGGIGGNIVRTIMNLAGQTRAFGDAGGSLLTTLEQLTSRMAAWSASAQGQQTAATLFRTLGESARQVATVLPLLLSPLGLIVKALAGMPPGLQSVVGKMIGWSIIIGVIANRLRALTVITAGWTAATKAATGAMTAFRAVAGAAGLAGFVTGLRNVNAAMAANATTATRLGAALRSQILLWRQQAAAAGVSTARIIVNAAAQRIAAAATRVWAAAQAVFNAIMSANPIALIVIGIAALVAAVVLAYRRFEGFRNLVNTVWAAIRTAFQIAWAFIQPILQQIGAIVMTVVAGAFRWLMSTVQTVWSVMSTVIGVAWAIIRPILSTIATIVRTVLGIAFTVLMNTVKIAWIAIQLQIKVAWAIIKGVFNAIRAFITGILAPVFRWLWNNVIRPAWNGIRAAISTAWAIIKGIFNAIRNVINTVLAPIFRWLWNNVIKPVWNSIKNHISTVYNTGIKPAFDKLRGAVGKVKDAFSTAVEGIKKIWNGLKKVTKDPVNFVIGIYNDGIVNLVNKIAGFAGIKTRLDKIPKFARGGIMPGYAPGVDSLIAAVSPGEAIMRPEFTRAVGAGFIHRANDVARRSGVEGVRKWLTGPDAIGGEGLAFSRGGIVPRFAGHYAFGGIIGDFVRGVRDFTIGNVGKAAKNLLDRILGGTVPGAGLFRDVIAAIPAWIKDHILKWIKDKIDSGVGGPAVQRALRFAKAQAGKPYVWGGVGPGGYDCCLVGETLIYGPKGAKRIDEIQPGDLVWSFEDGKMTARAVTAAWQSITQQTFRVRTRNRTVVASANHPFMRLVPTAERYREVADVPWPGPLEGSRVGVGDCSVGDCGEPVLRRGMCTRHYQAWHTHGDPRVRCTTRTVYRVEWARLDELRPGDLLVQSKRMVSPDHMALEPTLPDGTPVAEDVAWLVGALVGDGTVTDKGLRLCLYGEKRDRATRIIAERWGCNPSHGQSYGLVVSCIQLSRALTAMGMRKLGPDKRIPKAVWTWSADLQRAFLDGYCDADGHRPADTRRHGERTYHSASWNLISEVRALHMMLGDAVSNITVTERTKPITIKGKVIKHARPQYGFTVWGRTGRGETKLRRRPGLAEWLDSSDFTLAPVLEISDAGVRDTYDIEVEGAHNFVGDGVLLHNSGFMSAITNVIQGRNPYSRRFTTFSFTGARQGPAGFVRNLRSGFVVGITNAGVGHMAGTLGGVNVESRGSAGVVVGRAARGAGDGLFNMRYGLKFDRGGLLQPGWTLAYNGLGHPEPVFPSVEAAAAYGAQGRQITVQIGPVYVEEAADVDMLAQRLEFQLRGAGF